jgi:hypothetical protein
MRFPANRFMTPSIRWLSRIAPLAPILVAVFVAFTGCDAAGYCQVDDSSVALACNETANGFTCSCTIDGEEFFSFTAAEDFCDQTLTAEGLYEYCS